MEKAEIVSVIAENVRGIMNAKGITSPVLSRKCNITTGTISKIINGQMNLTVQVAMKLAEGLEVSINDLLKGLTTEKITPYETKSSDEDEDRLSIGVLSINNKRITCVKNQLGDVLGTSELEGGLDLTETSGDLREAIIEAILQTSFESKIEPDILKNSKLNLVTQSYEFEDTRSKFILFAKKYFHDVILMPDWQITYLADFSNSEGISLVTDKGVSLSYKHNGTLKKLGGWKFPVYDFGGENWLGAETIHHTIEAAEGYIPMSNLAHTVLAKFNGKIEKITETCFKGAKDPDIYCLFTEPLLRCCVSEDPAAIKILESGAANIKRLVERADAIVGKKLKISINGSLANIYKSYFPKERLIIPSSDAQKANLLADVTKDYLEEHGIVN